MFEICGSAVFDNFFPSRGPEIDLFSHFKAQWDFIDKSKFDCIDSDGIGAGCLSKPEKVWLQSRHTIVIDDIQQHLVNLQPREDYREFVLQLLGAKMGFENKFFAPGAYHHAR